MGRPLPPTVKTLGLVSLLNDVSSEMIYPLLPRFLTHTLRAGPLFLGAVEGLAEAGASLLKIASGWLSDRLARRKPLVVLGYALSSLARPLVAVATAGWQVLAVRVADRVGKGTRSAPRDAMLADVTPADQRGRAYGFHRAMDHGGAVLGPLAAWAILALGADQRTLFALAAIPAAVVVVVLLAAVREAPRATAADTPEPAAVSGIGPRRGFGAYLVVLAAFTLGNSSDAFLLLRAEEVGVPVGALPLLWTTHHLVKAAASTYGGTLSDRIGRRRAILLGWTVYAAAYTGFAVAEAAWQVWLAFGVYGLHYALTEGPERAMVADLAGGPGQGRAFGLYHAVTGAMLLPAGLLTGALWQAWGPPVALFAGAGLAAVAAFGLLALVPEPQPREGSRGGRGVPG
jgi:MFS family permease